MTNKMTIKIKNKIDIKTIQRLVLLLATSMVFAGCSNESSVADMENEEVITESINPDTVTTSEDTQAVTVSIKIFIDGQEQTALAQAVTVPEGTTLMEVMTENYEIAHENTFITEINGHPQDLTANRFWLYDINGEMAMVGMAEYELKEGDDIEWKLEDSDL